MRHSLDKPKYSEYPLLDNARTLLAQVKYGTVAAFLLVRVRRCVKQLHLPRFTFTLIFWCDHSCMKWNAWVCPHTIPLLSLSLWTLDWLFYTFSPFHNPTFDRFPHLADGIFTGCIMWWRMRSLQFCKEGSTESSLNLLNIICFRIFVTVRQLRSCW